MGYRNSNWYILPWISYKKWRIEYGFDSIELMDAIQARHEFMKKPQKFFKKSCVIKKHTCT
jgi:hypothetical protein